MTVGRFLAGVGVLLMEPESGRYLLLRRAGHRDFGAGVWESVTGRVDQGEAFGQAALREAREELGVDVSLRYLLGTVHFYRGAAVPENEMVGVVYAATIEGDRPARVGDEHSEARWVTSAEAADLLDRNKPAEAWLLRVIRRAELLQAETPRTLADIFAAEGFEMDRDAP